MRNNKINRGKLYSWPMIILLIIVFFPVGFYLMYKKLSVESKLNSSGSLSKNSINLFEGKSNLSLLKYGAYFCLFIAISAIVMMLDEGIGSDNISIMILFGVIGALLLNKYNKDKSKVERYTRYVYIIKNETDLRAISRIVEVPVDIVISEINHLINEGLIKGAYIDYSTNKLVLNESERHAEKPKEVVVCKSCGAKNILDARKSLCEYCGTIL